MGALLIFSSTVLGIPTGIVSGVLMLVASAILFFAVWVYNKNARLAEERSKMEAADAHSLFVPPQDVQAAFMPSYSQPPVQAVEYKEALPVASAPSALPPVSWNAPFTPPADPVQLPPQPVPFAEPAPVMLPASSEPAQQPVPFPESTLKCPSCGHPAQPDDNFCLQCGHVLHPLVTVMPTLAEPAPVASSMPPLPETPPLPVENKDEHEIAASPVEPVAAAASVQADEVKVSAEAAAARDSVKPVEGTAATNERPARLVLRSNSGDVIHEYELTKLVLSVGRASHNDIILPKDKLTSRHHVTLRREGDQWSILDEQSANGTYVDDKKIAASTPHELRDGSKIRIGVHRLVFYAQYQPISSLEDMPTIVDEYSTRQDEALAVAAASELDELNVSAFYPHTVAAEKWNTLLVYMHLESVIDTIYKDAGRHKLSIAQTPPKTGAQSQTPQLPEPKVTLVPDFQGMMFNPKRMTFTWSEAWKRSVFRFIAKKELLGTTTNGKVSVFIGPLLVATLNVAIRCEQQTGKGKDYDTEVTTQLYKRIYAAYSPEDALVAQAYQDVYKLPGFEFLEKVDKLRSNNTFNDEQKRMLEQAEVFQLFWSAHAKDSAALAEEWQYALQQQKGEDFVRPVYWEIPLVPPSKDLAALQFTYIPEYTFAESSSKIASISTSSSKSVPAVKAEPASKDIPVAKAEPVSKDVPPAKEDQPAKETSSPRDELPSKDEAVSKDEVSAKDEPVLDPPVLKEEKAAKDEPVSKDEVPSKDEPVLEEEKAIEDKPVSKDEISPKEKPVLKEEKATRDEPASAQEVLSKDEAILDQHPTEDEPVSEDDAL